MHPNYVVASLCDTGLISEIHQHPTKLLWACSVQGVPETSYITIALSTSDTGMVHGDWVDYTNPIPN